MNKIDILLNFLGTLLAIVLASTLIRRKVYREFPFFFIYIVSSILIAVARVSVSGNYLTFFKIVWTTEAIYALLVLLALHEVFRTVFVAFYKRWWFWLFFPGMVAAIFGLTIIYHSGKPPVQATGIIRLILSLGTAVSLVQVTLFLLFFMLVWFHGIHRRDYAFGVVLGFAAMAIGALGGNWARSEFGTKFNHLFSFAPSVAYIVAVVLWLDTFRRPPEPEPKWTHKITPEQLLGEIQQYTKLLERYWARRK